MHFSKRAAVAATILLGMLVMSTSCRTTSQAEQKPLAKASMARDVGKGGWVVKKSSVKAASAVQAGMGNWIAGEGKEKKGEPASAVRRMHVSLASGDISVAQTIAREILTKEPSDVSALTVLIASLIVERNFELANHYASLLERRHPGRSEPLNARGLLTLATADNRLVQYYRAAELFQLALAKSPDEIAAGLNLGRLQLGLGNSKAAAKAFSQARNRCDDCRDAVLGHADALSVSGAKVEAKKLYDELVQNDRKDFEAQFRLAVLHKNGFNDFKSAENQLLRIMKENKEGSRNWTRANSYLRAIRLEKDQRPTESASIQSGEESNEIR
jgi:tetratricopeptide (TPR) repeat protein